MNRNPQTSKLVGRALIAGALIAVARLALAGPPFMTDDPEPIEYRHSEAYMFSTTDKGPDGRQTVLPAFEYNTSPIEDVHLHIVVPILNVFPAGGPGQHGLGDVELGVKYRFVHETEDRPQIGVFPMLETPTGNLDKGLGNGRAWWTFPLWVQKSWGPWTTYGGGGRAFNSAPGMRNYDFGGWLLQRDFGKKLTLGGEIFGQGAPSAESRRSTFLNFGGYYKEIDICGKCSLLFRIGHTVAGESHSGAYLGLYWSM